MVRLRRVTFLLVTCGFAASLFACDEGLQVGSGCGAIASGGCPGESQENCADPACVFVALCDVGVGRWNVVSTCDRRAGDGGVLADGGALPVSDAAVRDGGSSSSTGCPPLQEPDCSDMTRAACPSGCCGCEDVFRCVSGGWDYVGPCNP